MMSLSLSSWLWFYHNFIFHLLNWSYINIGSCRLLPRYASHYCEVMAFIPCWLIIIIHYHIDGLDFDCFPPLEACINLSGTMKVSNQVGGFQVRFDLRVSCSCTQSELCHQQYGLSFYLWEAALTIANKVFGVSWTTLTNNSKEDFSYLVCRSVRLSKAYGSSIVSSDEKISFKLYMYMYISTYIYYYMYL